MSALAGTLGERVTLLERAATRDDLGGAAGDWRDGATRWAAVALDGIGEDGRARFAITLRAGAAAAGRVRWRGSDFRVRRIEVDPAAPDRVVLRVEAV